MTTPCLGISTKENNLTAFGHWIRLLYSRDTLVFDGKPWINISSAR